MANVSSNGSRIIIEGEIPKADPTWKFEIDEIVFTVDGVGFAKLYLEEPWTNSERQQFLLEHNCIFKTPKQASERQRHIMLLCTTIDRAEAE